MTSSDVDVRKPLQWSIRIAISLNSLICNTARRSDGSINRRFFNLFHFRSPPTPTPTASSGPRSVSTSDVTVNPSRNLWFRLFVPSSAAENSIPVVVFFHGGGFNFYSADSFFYNAVCRRFAGEIPAVIVSVNYRLAPEHKFPCQYDDGSDVLAFLDANGDSVLPTAADPKRCFLAGDSAGGNLAHHLAVRAARGSSSWTKVKVEGLIAIQPFFGGEERTEAERRQPKGPVVTMGSSDWMWKAFLPEGASRDHAAANVSGPNAEDISSLAEFPRTIVVVGGVDPLQDWQRRYFRWLRSAGKEAQLLDYPHMIHAFYMFPELPESGQLLTQLRDFIYLKEKQILGSTT